MLRAFLALTSALVVLAATPAGSSGSVTTVPDSAGHVGLDPQSPCVPVASPPDVIGEEVTLSSGLVYIDFAPGTGEVAEVGDTVAVNYRGWLQDTGELFDSSFCRNELFQFVIGAGVVIQGWDLGVPGLAQGGQRRLIIPPELAWGDVGAGGAIPPNATLIFDIELVEILAKAPTPTPTPIGEIVVWGDANCKDGVNPVDSLLTLRHDAHFGGTSTPGCPSLGQAVDVLDASLHIWGDVDCSGEVTPVDSLKILRHDAGLSSSKADPSCPDMGAEVIVTPGPPALGGRAAGLLESAP